MVMFRVLLGWVRGDPTVSALDFRVFDEPTQQAVNVLLYRQPGKGGMVNLGDRVRVYGKSEGRSRIIRAHKVHVYESGGHRADYTIEAMKPWPIWLGALVLGGTVAGLLYALWQMGIMFN